MDRSRIEQILYEGSDDEVDSPSEYAPSNSPSSSESESGQTPHSEAKSNEENDAGK